MRKGGERTTRAEVLMLWVQAGSLRLGLRVSGVRRGAGKVTQFSPDLADAADGKLGALVITAVYQLCEQQVVAALEPAAAAAGAAPIDLLACELCTEGVRHHVLLTVFYCVEQG